MITYFLLQKKKKKLLSISLLIMASRRKPYNHHSFLLSVKKISGKISEKSRIKSLRLSPDYKVSSIPFDYKYLQNRNNFNVQINQFLRSMRYRNKLTVNQLRDITKILNYYSMHDLYYKIKKIYKISNDDDYYKDYLFGSEDFHSLYKININKGCCHDVRLQYMIYVLLWKKTINIPKFIQNYVKDFIFSSLNKNTLKLKGTNFMGYLHEYCKDICVNGIVYRDYINCDCDLNKLIYQSLRKSEMYSQAKIMLDSNDKDTMKHIKLFYVAAIIQQNDMTKYFTNYQTVIALFALSEHCYKNKEYQIGLKVLKSGYQIGHQFMLKKFINKRYPKQRKKLLKKLNIQKCDGIKCNEFAKKSCTGCMEYFYCSKSCQKYDWKDRHRESCDRSWEYLYTALKNYLFDRL